MILERCMDEVRNLGFQGEVERRSTINRINSNRKLLLRLPQSASRSRERHSPHVKEQRLPSVHGSTDRKPLFDQGLDSFVGNARVPFFRPLARGPRPARASAPRTCPSFDAPRDVATYKQKRAASPPPCGPQRPLLEVFRTGSSET